MSTDGFSKRESQARSGRRGLRADRRGRRRLRVSPAGAIAMLALLLAAGGGAYAVAGTPTNLEWAIVTPAGKLARHHGAVEAKQVRSHHKVEPGVYEVEFNEDVSSCAYSVTLGSPGTKAPPSGQVGVTRLTRIDNTLVVHTTNARGKGFAAGFHLIITC